MSYTNARIPMEISFLTFHDDELPATGVMEFRKGSNGGGGGDESALCLTTGSFPQEVVLSTIGSFANVRRIELTLDEAKEVVVERCALGDGSAATSPTAGGGSAADPMSAPYEVIAERVLTRGAVMAVPSKEGNTNANGKPAAAAAAAAKGDGPSSDLVPRKRQVEVLELDPTGAGRALRAIRVRLVSGYSDFVGIFGIAVYGEESEQRIAVLESKAEVNM